MFKCILFMLPWLLMAKNVLAEEPQWLKDARAREGGVAKAQPMKSKDGFFSAQVMGKMLNEVTKDEGAYAITLDIGSATPANCEVIVDGFDLAGILRATADLTLKELESVQGKIEQRAIERTDAGVVGTSPYIAVDWVYRVNDGKAPRLGALKQIAILKSGHGLYCAHADLGYSKSFFNAVRAFAETIEFSEGGTPVYFTEISAATLGDAKVGIVIATIERDAEGDSKLVATTSLALRLTPDTLRTQDSTHVQWAHPDGSLINASHIVSANGALEANLSLSLSEDESWVVKGDFKGKALEEVIKAARAPATWIEISRMRKQAFAQENIVGVKLNVLQWTMLDPTRFVDSQTTLLSVVGAGNISAQESFAGITAEHVLDKTTGMPISSVMQVGPLSIKLERVYTSGSF